MAKKIPDAAPLTGTEAAIVIQNGKAVKTTVQDIANRVPTVKGQKGDQGPQGTPKRVERFTGSTNASGVALITFSPAFTAVPDIDVIDGWLAEQQITGAVVPGTATVSGCQVQVMVSRATLLLSTGPFQKATSGLSITVRAIG